MFKLHPQLQKDCFFIKDLKISQLLLVNNSNYPWFILVPKIENAVELTDLSIDNQQILLAEINQISKLSQDLFKYEKLNIATLGNVVSQLHIHIISRYKNDRMFPKPVWGDETKPYGKEVTELISKIVTIIEIVP
jgi:diadenosine tetraphosphate (Ap4A) HIT family hydrolase